ncbi:MAG TPA: sulfate transporter CysZ, partial [Thiothrix sp.]|nr:sulfate transporter CysZ [Thiothrix sp.]
MLTAPFKGLGYLVQGFPLLFHKGIRPFVVVPLLINIVLFSLAIWFGIAQFDQWMDQLLPTYLDWLMWLIWPLFAVLTFFAIFYTFAI